VRERGEGTKREWERKSERKREGRKGKGFISNKCLGAKE